MANKRMFNIKIVDSDAFLDMPLSTQCLYFHLNMRADDDGFIGNPKKIMRMVGCSEDDLKLLIAKRFVLTFENGVIVIKHWKMHNCIQTDRYTPTVYIDEKNMLFIKQNKSYTLDEEKKYIPVSKTETKRNQNGNKMETNRIQSVYADIDIDIGAFASEKVKDAFSLYILCREKNGDKLDHNQIKLLADGLKELSTDPEEQLSIIQKATVSNWKSFYPVTKKTEKKATRKATSKKNAFNNFEGRSYDSKEIDEIEGRLLSK